MGEIVTHRTHPADTTRERARLWRVQTLMAATIACGSIGALWLATTLGAGAAGAAGVLVGVLAPMAVAPAIAAWLSARVARRALLSGAPAVAAGALLAAALVVPSTGLVGVMVCAVVLGAARAAFDGATADLLHQLTAEDRRGDACQDLTARFGAGWALGIAGCLGAGLLIGPYATLVLAAVLAASASVVAARHHPDLDLRVEDAPSLGGALARAARALAGDRTLRRVILTGAVATAVGAAQAAVLIVWLREGMGLRGALAPALIAGFVAARLGRPLVRRIAGRARMGSLLLLALGVQAAAALTAYTFRTSVGGAAAYALSLAAGAFLGILVTRALRVGAPRELAPAVGLTAGAVWALAACAGAAGGALMALGVGLAATHLAIAALALTGAAAVATRTALRGAGFLAPGPGRG
jgi:MFS transporter